MVKRKNPNASSSSSTDELANAPPLPPSSSSSPSSDPALTLPPCLEGYHFSDGTAITAEGSLPKKEFYRSRAHANPLSFNDSMTYPSSPSSFSWAPYFPNGGPNGGAATVLDIGCGFGGMTVALSGLLPGENVLGYEIRAKVCEYVRLRLVALRQMGEATKGYQNAAVMRANTMKNLLNYHSPKSLTKIFLLFPDPHFKAKNHRRRIVTYDLLCEYAYCMKEGATLYVATDVEELHNWHLSHCDAHPSFVRLAKGEYSGSEGEDVPVPSDPCVLAMLTATEEGKKVERSGSRKHYAVYRRVRKEEEKAGWTREEFFEKKEEEGGGEE